jgi:hypothetical protein
MERPKLLPTSKLGRTCHVVQNVRVALGCAYLRLRDRELRHINRAVRSGPLGDLDRLLTPFIPDMIVGNEKCGR